MKSQEIKPEKVKQIMTKLSRQKMKDKTAPLAKARPDSLMTKDEPVVKSALPTSASPVAYFVRHGETDLNKTNEFRGDLDLPLNEEGKKQAKQLVEFFHNVEFGKAYNSSRQRTKQTAEPLMKEKGMSSTTLRGLDSLDTGDFSGLPKDDSNLDKMEFYREHPDAQIPGGEKVREFHGRVDPELGRIIREGEDGGEPNVAFVHGSVIKELSRYLHGDIKAAQVEPGGVVGVFKIPAGGYVAKPLLKENDTSEDLPTGS